MMGNVAMDLSVFFMLALFWVLGIVVFIIARVSLKRVGLWRKDSLIRKYVVVTWIGVGALASVLWVVFGAYGPGEPVDLPSPKEDGFRKAMRDLPAEIVHKEDDKLPAILREVQENSASDAGADEYILNAIERSKRMIGN